jgi:SAM-dependent methyltransferase
LDVGSGAGHWSIAFARHNREVLGVERDRDFVVIAKRMAVRFGVHDRVTFELGSVSDVVLPDRSFDLSCCHSVLMFVDHEVTLSRIARWTADGGSFYCGYTGEGARVQDVVEGVLDGDERRARHGLSVLLSDVRLRAGIGRGLGLRGLRREELEGMCHQLGFDVVDRPDVQDGRREFLGLPCTFDFVCRRRSGDPVEHLFGLDPDAREWSAGVASLVEAGLPRHALAVLEQLPRGKLSAPPLAELKLRARLLLGEEVEGDEALDRLDPPTRALLTGMSRQLAGAHEQALQAYADADAENSAPDMLTALCLLELKRHDEALALAAAQRGDGDGIGRLAITVAALIGARGLAAAREAVSAWQPSGATRVRSTLS